MRRAGSEAQVDRPGAPGSAGGGAWQTSMGSSRRVQDGRAPPGIGEVIDGVHVPVEAPGTPPQRATGHRFIAIPIVSCDGTGLLCRWWRV